MIAVTNEPGGSSIKITPPLIIGSTKIDKSTKIIFNAKNIKLLTDHLPTTGKIHLNLEESKIMLDYSENELQVVLYSALSLD